jgi:hypothetical protein
LEPDIFGHSKAELFLDTISAIWITFEYLAKKFFPHRTFGFRVVVEIQSGMGP